MKIKSFRLESYKGFRNTGDINLENMTGIIGLNSSGKSTIVEAIKSTLLQDPFDAGDNTKIGSSQGGRINCILNLEDGRTIKRMGNIRCENEISPNLVDNILPIYSRALGFCHQIGNTVIHYKKRDLTPSQCISDIIEKKGSDTIEEKGEIQTYNAWLNILSSVDLSMKDILSIDSSELHNNYTKKISENLTEIFNSYFSESLGRHYEFLIKFSVTHTNLPVMFRDFETSVYVHFNVRYRLLNDSKFSTDTMLYNESDGLRTLLTLISYILNDERFFFILDEPFANINPTLHTDIVKVLKDISRNSQIIYTTHSPYLYQENMLYCVNQSVESLMVKTESQLNEEEQRMFVKEFSQIPPSNMPMIKLIRQAINDQKSLIVYVEGKTDKRYIEYAITKLDKELLKYISIISVGGSPNVKQCLRLERIKSIDQDNPKVVPSILGVLDPEIEINENDDIPDLKRNVFLFKLNKNNSIETGIESIFPCVLVDKIMQSNDSCAIMHSNKKVRSKPKFETEILSNISDEDLESCFGELIEKIKNILSLNALPIIQG